jgi:4,5-DOPA dioxygenase extradiol
MSTMPALFVSHGSPMLALSDEPAGRFFDALGPSLPRPDAILLASAHFETEVPTLGAVQQPETIHDFHGFPEPLYQVRYPATGAPGLARLAAERITAAGLPVRIDDKRGLDHGAWVPLRRMYPAADIPVATLSIQPHLDPAHHYAVGQALRALRDEGVMVLASGSLTHNLRALDWRGGPDAPVSGWAKAFIDWVAAAVDEGRTEDLLNYRRLAPEAVKNHPADEHFLPFFVALGAGDLPGRRLHASVTMGALAMDAYSF